MCRRRFLTIVLPLHVLGELLYYTPKLVVQFWGQAHTLQGGPMSGLEVGPKKLDHELRYNEADRQVRGGAVQ